MQSICIAVHKQDVCTIVVMPGGGAAYFKEVEKDGFYMYDNTINRTHILYQTGVISFASAAFSPSHLSITADNSAGVISARF